MAEYIEKWSVVNRLIDIENEFQQYKPFHGFEHAMYRKICEAEIAIGKTQAVDVAPVRHGRWVMKKTSAGASYTLCSHCNSSVKYNDEYGTAIMNLKGANYCPNCGARMDGEVSE